MRVGLFNSGGSNITNKINRKPNRFGTVETYEEVKTRTLDSYKFTDVDFIKIDVEGHEWIVLESGFETIKQCDVLMIEMAKNHRNWNDMHNYFEERGFQKKRFRYDTIFWKE